MADKTCPQCSETVGEAKAFCPSCGHSFEDEARRTDASAYDKADSTVQLGQTMYNNLLSDMGLNVAKEPEKRVETLKPVSTGVQVLQPLTPVSQPAAAVPSAAAPAEPEKKSNSKVWLITIITAVALLLIFLVAVVLVGLYLYFRSGRF